MHALPAHRLLDTRSGLGAPKAAVAAGTSVSFQVAGREGVPTTGVGAVALTITVVSPTGAGFVTAYASGAAVPTASSLNFAAGDIASNLVVTRLSADGRAELRVGGSGSAQLLAEVVGWVEAGDATEPGAYAPLAPQRLLDTRNGTGTPMGILAGGSTVTLPVAGRGGVPADGAGAVLLNVTATGGTAAGYLTVGPTLTGTVTTSNLNYSAGQVRANLVIVPLSDTGSVDLRATSNGSVHAIADVVGWVRAGTPVTDGAMAALAPARLLDTRTDGGGQIFNNGWAEVPVTGVAGVPYAGVHAVLLNVTATRATAQGRVSVLPSASNLPTGSQMQFTKGRNDANLVLAPVSPDGWVDLLVQSSGSVDLVADVVGYVTGPPVDSIPPAPVTSLVVTQPTKNSVTLSWQNPTDADLTGVTIRRVVDGATSSDPFEGTVVAETTGTTFTDTNLTPGTTYGYSVWAHDSFPNISNPVEVAPATTPLAWSAPVRVAPFVGSPRAVTCVTTAWCMAGDASGQFLTWNGTAWSAPTSAVAVAEGEDDGGFGSLSCVSTSFCMGVAGHGGLVTYRAGAWSAVTRITSSTGVELQAATVDCTSATFCVAVGQGDDWKGWTARFNGTSWTTATKLTAPSGQVDCVSTTFCMAIGQDMYGAGWATRWNGSTWTSTKIQPNGSSTYDVSCTSASFCMATSSGGLSVRWNGSSWSTLPTFDSTNAFQGGTVACTSTTFCLTVDSGLGQYSRWNGTSWSRPARFGSPSGLRDGVHRHDVPRCRRPRALHALQRDVVGEPGDVRRDPRRHHGPLVRGRHDLPGHRRARQGLPLERDLVGRCGLDLRARRLRVLRELDVVPDDRTAAAHVADPERLHVVCRHGHRCHARRPRRLRLPGRRLVRGLRHGRPGLDLQRLVVERAQGRVRQRRLGGTDRGRLREHDVLHRHRRGRRLLVAVERVELVGAA